MHSVSAWIAGTGTYGVVKAALIAITNTLRQARTPRGTQVLGIQRSYTDTHLIRHLDAPKNDPRTVARDIVAAFQHGDSEVIVEDLNRPFKAARSGPVEWAGPFSS